MGAVLVCLGDCDAGPCAADLGIGCTGADFVAHFADFSEIDRSPSEDSLLDRLQNFSCGLLDAEQEEDDPVKCVALALLLLHELISHLARCCNVQLGHVPAAVQQVHGVVG
ncbi:unnamed protein product [Phytophthora fragariaefolia]|uniref:Unnamed protein product n=1 Tax=Phytophthora fragariaefolia TaxID=1490495 RepID=A0A9W6TW41_9STRA|nr:unnamed protein product [Phytophthora fragariaefolia]